MQTAVAVLGPVKALEDVLVFVELPLLDGHVDPDDVLPHHPPRADVQVADRMASVAHTIALQAPECLSFHSPYFRVAHEPIAEANRNAVCMQVAVTMVLRNRVHVRRVSCLDRVALRALLRSDAPAIVHTAVSEVSVIQHDK